MLHPIIILLSLAVCSAHPLSSDLMEENATPFNDERIIGGEEVLENRHPFMLRMDVRDAERTSYLCGASLLHHNYVVTAAHCVQNSRKPFVKLTLYFGDHSIKQNETTEYSMEISMEHVLVHTQYDDRRFTNDIALIKLPKPAPLSKYVKPICVGSPEKLDSFHWGTAMGWGYTRNDGRSSNVLKQVYLTILYDKQCHKHPTYDSSVMICAGNDQGKQEAVCSGDSGGPLIVDQSNPVLVGIASFVSGYGCVAVGHPVVFTKVHSFIPWLRSTMGDSLCVL